jgi:hypothetical protein
VPVCINGPLPCNKTDEQYPGANDMSVTFFHQQGMTIDAKVNKEIIKSPLVSNNVVVKNVCMDRKSGERDYL